MSRLWDVWQSDVEGGETHRVEAPSAREALVEGARIERARHGLGRLLITAREVSGERERAESWAIPGEEVTP